MANNSIWISTDLVLKNTKYADNERILIMTGDSVDLIEAVADVAGNVDVYDINFSTLKRLRHYVRKDNVQFFDDVYPAPDSGYDTAIVFVPKGRDFGRAQMWSAMNALKEGGDLYLVGPNKAGAKSLIKDAIELFGDCQVMDYKKSHRVAVSRKESAHYDYPSDWGDVPTEKKFISITTALGTIEVATQPGVFSWKELDEGTHYLLENLVLRDDKTALDVGCGYGVIGALLASKLEHVTLVDNNLLAISCAKATLAHNNIENATVIASNVFSEVDSESEFDLIISNPPFHRGFDLNTNVPHKIMKQAPDYLAQGGRLVLVANEFLKYNTVMEENFKQAEVRARNTKFKVLEGIL
ncbi:MAG: 16S rRNA (guanine(1207)-N(2))-methyltransferase RsmC [Phototrophicaceae bacterium]